MQIYIDGQFYSREDAKISVFDHGLLYGDGVFEGIRVYNKRVFELDAHIARLYNSAKAIALRVPLDREALKEATLETVRRNELTDGYIRLVVTRGIGDLGLNPMKCPVASIFVIAATIQLYPEDFYKNGLHVMTCSTRRNSPQAIDPGVKSLNYLNNILGAVELQGSDCQEGLMLNLEGYVAECTADNFFMVRGGKVCTPAATVGVLRGITRSVILRLAEEAGLEVEEGFYTLYDVYTADEAFLSGTGAEIAPVVAVDRRAIGSGRPGIVTQNLIQRFREYTQVAGTPVYPEVAKSA